jgi:hypothetical protein
MKLRLVAVQLDDKDINQTQKTVSGLYWELTDGSRKGFTEVNPPVHFGHLEFEDTPNEVFLDLIKDQIPNVIS